MRCYVWSPAKVVPEVFLKISENSLKNTCSRVFFNKVAAFEETLAQVFSCEFCKIFKNTSFYRTPAGNCF